MDSERTKECSRCKQVKQITCFTTKTQKGKKYLSSHCRDCCNARDRARRRNPLWEKNKEADQKYETKRALKRKEDRASIDTAPKFVLWDSRKSDRKKGRDNDLDIGFVTELLERPCSYCESREMKMTLDRVDNTLGHLQSNVVPACFRCNIIRRDMPSSAWAEFVPVLKEVTKKGLFGEWCSKPFNRK
jgi:hypothetical protein